MVVLAAIALLPLVGTKEPGPGILRTRTKALNTLCERVDPQTAKDRYPGRFRTTRPRGDYVERSAVICREQLVRRGLRGARDEAVLNTLSTRATEVASAAVALRPDLAETTWLVETFYPNQPVASKIGFATKNALMGQGVAVSDRTPVLSAGDVDVLTRMGPKVAYGAACERYYATGGLSDDHTLLAVVSRDRRDTVLHAGVCNQGRWMWLR